MKSRSRKLATEIGERNVFRPHALRATADYIRRDRVVYDAETGQAITASFMDYAIPRAATTCAFEMTMDEWAPCLANPMGVRDAVLRGFVALS